MNPGLAPAALALVGRAAALALALDQPHAASAAHPLELPADAPLLKAEPQLAQAPTQPGRGQRPIGDPHRDADADEPGEIAGAEVAHEGEQDLDPEEPARLHRKD